MSAGSFPHPDVPPPLPPGLMTPPPAPSHAHEREPVLVPNAATDRLTPTQMPRGRARKRFPASSIAWSLLACTAVGYLAIVLTRPDLVPRMGAAPTPTSTIAEVEHLRGAIEALREELAEIRSQVSATGAEQRALSERMAALSPPASSTSAEADLAPAELRLDPAPVTGPLNARSTAEVLKTAPSPVKKTADAKPINAAPEKKIETGSVKPAPSKEPPPFGPAVVSPSDVPAGIQIATGSSLDSLRLSWNLLSETHASSLKNLEPRYSMSVDDNGLVYNLMAGPVKSADEAKKMCKALSAKAIPCTVVNQFGGAAL